MNATAVRAKAAQLVRSHAERLGMDRMAAAVLVQAIENIPDAGGWLHSRCLTPEEKRQRRGVPRAAPLLER